MTNSKPSIDALIEAIKSFGTGAGGLYTHSMMLTPSIAQMLLEHNTVNRPLNERRVRAMTDSILAGDWKANGTSISITCGKKVGDGQHRCTAVVRTGVAIPVVVVYGVADDIDTLATIDQGTGRTVQDIIAIDRNGGTAPDNNVIAVSNLLSQITDGVDIPSYDRPAKARFAVENSDEIEPWVSWANQMAIKSAPLFGGKRGIRSVGATALTTLAIHMYRSGADPDMIQEFYQGVIDPWAISIKAMLDMTENRRELLEALHRRTRQVPLNRSGGNGGQRMLLGEFAVHIIAYNRYIRNERVQVIRPFKEDFRYLSDLPSVLPGSKWLPELAVNR